MAEPFHPDRLQRLAELAAAGVDAFPARAPEGREPAASLAAAADRRGGETVVTCGRVLGRRGYGRLAFLDLWDGSGRIQACLQQDRLPAAEFGLLKALHRGDQVAVRGELGRTRTGEPTIFAVAFQILAKALLDPPEKWHGLADAELRARLRYVDLFSNREVQERFRRRSALVAALRRTLQEEGYIEVETPVLHPIYGGAAARPFATHHNTLDMRLYLRIAPELYLKRLLVGGLERVFELGRVFRNEGVSPRHNPEFTMLEFYEAWSDYRRMAALTETLVRAAAQAADCRLEDGTPGVCFRGRETPLSAPFPRRLYRDLFRETLGFEPEEDGAVAAAHRERDLPPREGREEYVHWRRVHDLFEEAVEPALEGPVFVLDYPAAVSPLAKPLAEDPRWAERFEFFLGGMELANAFSELNDPRRQLENFRQQVADRDPEMPEELDWDFVRALAYGMPPAGGCGIGVDRLAMVLLGAESIREVLLFPLLRPEAGNPGDQAP